jgi:hypothetical protein
MAKTLHIGRYRRPSGVLGLVLGLVLLLAASARAADDPPPSQFVFMPMALQEITQLPPVGDAPLCRYGVAAWGDAQLKWLPTWRAGWTLDFATRASKPNLAAEYYQMISVSQRKAGCDYLDGYNTSPALTEASLGNLIRSAPGSTWIVGNEPDRGPNPENCRVRVQGDTYPEVYAEAYHDVYDFIKQRDPHALVAIAGLVQVTPGRLQYLDKVWQAYQERYQNNMPVDIWNMHLYILPETFSDGRPNGVASVAVGTDPALGIRESGGDPARCADPQVYCFAEHDDLGIFAEQVVAMRTWMKQHGQQNKPLILSEYSQLYPYEVDPEGCFLQDEFGNCFTPERVSSFMSRSFAYLETASDPDLGYPLDNNRLIQRWLWFSANRTVGSGQSSNLLHNTLDQLTVPGKTFQAEVLIRDAHINLRFGQVSGYSGYVRESGQTTTATLFADVFNNGSVDATAPMTVTFYADSALTQPIMAVPVSESIQGCAWPFLRVHATWPDLPVGVHPFWVRVDDGNVVIETDETDNVGEGSVTVYRYGVMLPIVLHR